MDLTCSVDIRLIDLDDESLSPLSNPALSDDETQRAARFHFEADRRRWSRARSALRHVLAEYCSLSPEEIRFQYGPHGKPALIDSDDVEFNISHSGRWALLGVTRRVPVGIDIERIREGRDMAALLRRLGEPVPSDGLQELFDAWTRREALTKAAGTPLLQKPEGNYRVITLSAPDGYSAAVALKDHVPVPEMTWVNRKHL